MTSSVKKTYSFSEVTHSLQPALSTCFNRNEMFRSRFCDAWPFTIAPAQKLFSFWREGLCGVSIAPLQHSSTRGGSSARELPVHCRARCTRCAGYVAVC